ncbi:hypothetical protein [Agreia pratensis]|uniref:Uncharacterized protein n=1 Tax=Agreia pratensis TaxID=150121 RepID=A0A1X7K2K9_9MICO|nr:hypothetical protein [Agreia pratensis]SMG34914.1 hypothetical protein SAMN06296010_2000 [Agreia pratensis]
MALTNLTNAVTGYRAKAEELQNRLTSQTRAIENDGNLTDSGKREQIANQKESIKSSLAALKAQEMQYVRDTKDRLTRELFGSTTSDPSHVIAFRDAQDRADRLADPEEAIALLNRAEVSGDKSLSSAVLLKAVTSGWRSVTRAYSAEYPDTAEKLSDLQQVEEFEGPSMQRAVIYGVI